MSGKCPWGQVLFTVCRQGVPWLATTERGSEDGIAQGSPLPIQADAQLVRATTEADADLSWSQSGIERSKNS